jgi:hypothetical protein
MIRLSWDSTAPRRLRRKHDEHRRRREASAQDASLAGSSATDSIAPQPRAFYSVMH